MYFVCAVQGYNELGTYAPSVFRKRAIGAFSGDVLGVPCLGVQCMHSLVRGVGASPSLLQVSVVQRGGIEFFLASF